MADTDITERSKQETTPAGATRSQAAERGRHPLLTLRNEIDRLFDEASSMSPFSMFRFPWGRRSMLDVEPLFRSDEGIAAFAPPAEVDEREGEYRVRLEMPGMDEKAVDISLRDDVLTIKAEKKDEKEEKGADRYFSERRYGMCARSFRLPANVNREAIAANMRNGVLTVTLPKTEPSQPSGRRIEIAAG
jgi:HSP20 family protein